MKQLSEQEFQPRVALFSQSTRKKLDVEKHAHFPGSFMQTTPTARFLSSSVSLQPILWLQLERLRLGFVLSTSPLQPVGTRAEHKPRPFPPCLISTWKLLMQHSGSVP